jgi:hypothetical protein
MAEPIRPNFDGRTDATAPLTHLFEITPDDDNALEIVPRCIISDAAGTLVVDTIGGEESVAVPVFAGYNPIEVTKIYATGTTAGLTLVGGW